jgi:hypothetical protein
MSKTRTPTAAGIVLDAGALIALDRGDERMIALPQRAWRKAGLFACLRVSSDRLGATDVFRSP